MVSSSSATTPATFSVYRPVQTFQMNYGQFYFASKLWSQTKLWTQILNLFYRYLTAYSFFLFTAHSHFFICLKIIVHQFLFVVFKVFFKFICLLLDSHRFVQAHSINHFTVQYFLVFYLHTSPTQSGISAYMVLLMEDNRFFRSFLMLILIFTSLPLRFFLQTTLLAGHLFVFVSFY